MEENTRVIGKDLLVVSLKFPRESVKVPSVDPLITTDTALTASLVEAFFTIPLNVVDCAKETAEKNKSTMNKLREKGVIRFIIGELG